MQTNKSLHSNHYRTFSLTFYSILLITTLFSLLQSTAHAQNKLVDVLNHNQTQIKGFSLTFDKDSQQLHVNGVMEIGILPAFKTMLLKHPELTTVAFNSNGGNVYQARGLANIIVSNQLNTYVSKDCYSACTIAYVAGKTRYMSTGGKLGFHQYNIKSKMLNHRFNVKKEQAKDLSYFKSRIADNKFIEKIFTSKNSDLWIPENQHLLNSGVIHQIVAQTDR